VSSWKSSDSPTPNNSPTAAHSPSLNQQFPPQFPRSFFMINSPRFLHTRLLMIAKFLNEKFDTSKSCFWLHDFTVIRYQLKAIFGELTAKLNVCGHSSKIRKIILIRKAIYPELRKSFFVWDMRFDWWSWPRWFGYRRNFTGFWGVWGWSLNDLCWGDWGEFGGSVMGSLGIQTLDESSFLGFGVECCSRVDN
jgi:hypothetical protein